MAAVELKPVLSFLSALRRHNDREWFAEHRASYDGARRDFEIFVDRLIEDLRPVADMRGVVARNCISRIHRDIRFSPDKSPYRISMSAHLAPGRRQWTRLGYYLHLQPRDESLLATGLYMPTPLQLLRFREAIARDARRFKAITNAAGFKRWFGGIEGEKVKTAPKGFPRDHREIDLLRFKQILVVHRVPDDTVLSPHFQRRVVDAFTAMTPFVEYLNGVIGGEGP